MRAIHRLTMVGENCRPARAADMSAPFGGPCTDAEYIRVTAFVPSETACLASSPGRMRRTAVWTSRELRVALRAMAVSDAACETRRRIISVRNSMRNSRASALSCCPGCTC
eukprot:Amastigsp_a844394_19.p2 type:complete len:111 gc:universal Amastigsp_a844394_19:787-1119(+)